MHGIVNRDVHETELNKRRCRPSADPMCGRPLNWTQNRATWHVTFWIEIWHAGYSRPGKRSRPILVFYAFLFSSQQPVCDRQTDRQTDDRTVRRARPVMRPVMTAAHEAKYCVALQDVRTAFTHWFSWTRNAVASTLERKNTALPIADPEIIFWRLINIDAVFFVCFQRKQTETKRFASSLLCCSIFTLVLTGTVQCVTLFYVTLHEISWNKNKRINIISTPLSLHFRQNATGSAEIFRPCLYREPTQYIIG